MASDVVTDLRARTERVTPWDAGSWHGRVIDAGDITINAPLPPASAIVEVVAASAEGDNWDGKVAAIVKFDDGRYAAWETFYGPTGSGFSEDAYGGDADVWIGPLTQVKRLGLTNEGRRMLGLDTPMPTVAERRDHRMTKPGTAPIRP